MIKGMFFIALVFLGSYSLGLLLEDDKQPEALAYKSTCNLLNGSCHINDNDIQYEVSFDGITSHLTPFSIRLTSLNKSLSNIEVIFEMEGMNMGNNHYVLKNDGESWSAKVLLPVCSLGRNDWILQLRFLYKEKVHSTEFRFTQ